VSKAKKLATRQWVKRKIEQAKESAESLSPLAGLVVRELDWVKGRLLAVEKGVKSAKSKADGLRVIVDRIGQRLDKHQASLADVPSGEHLRQIHARLGAIEACINGDLSEEWPNGLRSKVKAHDQQLSQLLDQPQPTWGWQATNNRVDTLAKRVAALEGARETGEDDSPPGTLIR
jgi:hypothetical protein